MTSKCTYSYLTFLVTCIVLFSIMMMGCDDQWPPDDNSTTTTTVEPQEDTNACVSCHTDKDLLKEVADPVEYSEGTGEG